jgi:hypothetical protein
MISLLDPDSKEYFAFFPGKVLIGHLRDDDNTPIWAAFRRPKPSAKVQTLSGACRMCFFDDNFFEVELPEKLDGTVDFVAAFQLLTEGKDNDGTSKVWFARLSTCARVALVNAGLQDDEGFVTRQDGRLKELAAVIKKSWARLRRTLQGEGRDKKQEDRLPPPTRKSRKTRTADASTIDASTPDQTEVPADNQSGNCEQQAQFPTTVLMPMETSEDEDDIMETGYQPSKSDPWPTLPKRELITPAPGCSTGNKRQRVACSNHTSLLNFIDLDIAKDTTDTAALEEHVRTLTEAKASLGIANERKDKRIVELETTTGAMRDEIRDCQKKAQALKTFKARQVEHCQAVMLKLLTQRNLKNGSSPVDAERDAKKEYTGLWA